jgi:exopolysaccharide production protein ExoQ
MNDLITYIGFPLAALLLGTMAVGGMSAAARLAVHWRRGSLTVLMILISTASIGGIVLSGRILRLNGDGLENVGQADAATGAMGKLLLVSVIGCALALCAARVFDFNGKLSADRRYQPRGLAKPTNIMTAFMIFYFASSIPPIFFGVESYFHVKLIYPFFVYLAIFLWLPLQESDPIKPFKVATGMVVFTSLILAVIRPEAAIQPGYGGLIPGFNVRLWGTTSHANSLGAVTCGYILLEMAEPVRKRWMHLFLLGLAMMCLVLSQSKTSIGSVIAGGVIIYGTRAWHYFNQKGRSYNTEGSQILALLLSIACLLLAIYAAYAIFGEGSVLKSLGNKLDAKAVSGLSDGSGRLSIWSAAIDAGMQNPLFGQGANYWNPETRARLGLSFAIGAHNQYLQIFSLSGLVGLSAFLVFVFYLIRYGIRGGKVSDNATIAMLVVFLIRSMMETPITANAVLASEYLSMTGFIVFIIDRGARRLNTSRNSEYIGSSIGHTA